MWDFCDLAKSGTGWGWGGIASLDCWLAPHSLQQWFHSVCSVVVVDCPKNKKKNNNFESHF